MMVFQLSGKVVYKNIGTGCWGIIGDDGETYRVAKMPEKLKSENAVVNVTAMESDEMSMSMWGTPIDIITFETLG